MSGGSLGVDVTFLMVAAHGASGWLDEVIELGLPLVVLTALYIWSNRKPKSKEEKPK